jgi:SAM-dependent methyltransferase
VKFLDCIHSGRVFPRRVRRLAQLLSQAIPQGASVLDVGCGDGTLASILLQSRPDLSLQGLEVLVREQPRIQVQQFNGVHLPCGDHSFDIVMFVDVLHHTSDPMILLREAVRVARIGIVIKDHRVRGLLARARLRFMDYVGNARFGVTLPYNYWTEAQWSSAEQELGLKPKLLLHHLSLYPFPAELVFGAQLHFVARLETARLLSVNI